MNPQRVYACFACVLAIAAACRGEAPVPSAQPPRKAPASEARTEPRSSLRDVILISIDTQRVDRLGLYGYRQPTSPNLDRLAAESVVFDNHHAQAPLTLPSHVSLLTGLEPPDHGVRSNGRFRLGASASTLAEALKAKGYATAAIVSAGVLGPAFGLNQGFDVYSGDFSRIDDKAQSDAASATDRAMAWLDTLADAKRLFLFVHYYDPHPPFEAPPRFSFADPYDAEVAYVDEQIGRLLARLGAKKRLDGALVVVTSDHGESLGEHDLSGHTTVVYEETLHIPLIVRFPGKDHAGERVAALTRSTDVMPTILSFLGIGHAAAVDGIDLMPGIRRERPFAASDSYAETFYSPAAQFHQKALVSGTTKLVSLYLVAPKLDLLAVSKLLRPEHLRVLQIPEHELGNYVNLLAGLPRGRALFDLAADPKEAKNLYFERPDLASRMESKLAEHEGPLPGEPYLPESIVVEQLRNLGYFQ